MNKLYAKSVLYSYKSLEALTDQIDELVEKKALASMSDTAPAFQQYKRILDYTAQKALIIELKATTDRVLEKFSEEDKLYFDYKYFRKLPKERFEHFDTSCRAYFRKQNKLCKLFAERLEKAGVTDERFENEWLKIEFFRELLKRVKQREELFLKHEDSAHPMAKAS